MDETHLPCEFGASPFSGSREISYTNEKPQTDGTKNRTFCSSLRAVNTSTSVRIIPRNSTKKAGYLYCCPGNSIKAV